MFGLKLIITLDIAGLVFRNKSMTAKEAVKKLKSELDKLVHSETKKIKRCVFFWNDMHNDKFNIPELLDLCSKVFPNIKPEIAQFPAVITAHVGPNYIAVGVDIE
jgi:fatty acid-binding protein DegV